MLVRAMALVVTTLAVLLPSTRIAAQSDSAAAGRSIMSGVFNAEQAEKGKTTHSVACTSCHAATAYTGTDFDTAWNGRTAYDLFDMLRTTMPDDNPGALSKEEYVNVVAYIFSMNGFPAGAQPLSYDEEQLKQVKIDAPAPIKP